MPEASFLMPVFNDHSIVGAAIKSVLAQTDEHFQFVIVDDASDSTTRQVLEEAARADERIYLIRNSENFGITKSLNIGAKHCTGDIILRIDADDQCLPRRLELTKKAFFDDPSLAVLYSSYRVLTRVGEDVGLVIAMRPFWVKLLMRWVNLIAHPSVAYRRNVFIDAGCYNEAYRSGQDWELWRRLIQDKKKFARLVEPTARITRAMKTYRNNSVSDYRWSIDKFMAVNGTLPSGNLFKRYKIGQILTLSVYRFCPRLVYFGLQYVRRAKRGSP